MARATTKTPRATGAKAAGGRAAKPVAAEAAVVEEAVAAKAGLRMKDLMERVVAATGGTKKGVKEIVEATLAQMGEALKKGESLNLPGLGKVRVARQGSDIGGAMTLKLRQGAGGAKAKDKTAKEGLAEDADQD